MESPISISSRTKLDFKFGPGAFRLILALLVYVHHATSFGLGSLAVYLFFVLSGYWIAVMWRGKYSKAEKPYRTFVVSRWWRLLPVFLSCEALQLALLYLSGHPVKLGVAEIVPYSLILGYSSVANAPLVPAWSLDIEMQFYLLAPMLLRYLRGHVVAVTACICLVNAVSSLVLHNMTCVSSYAIFFLTGMIAAQLELKVSRAAAMCSACFCLLALAIILAIPDIRPLLLGGSHPSALHLQWNPAVNVAFAVASLPIALWSVTLTSTRLDKDFADLSYIVYLLHWVALGALTILVPGYGALPHASRALFLIGVSLLLAASSCAILYGVDRPLNRARNSFLSREVERKRPAPG